MKFSTLLITAFASIVLATTPAPDAADFKLVSYTIDNKTVVGEPAKTSVQKRSAQCDSINDLAFGAKCTPGNCDCQGDNGCWCWSDQPYCMCQCEPALGENQDCNCGLGNPCDTGIP